MDRESARQEIRRNWRKILQGMTGTAKQRVNGEKSYICPLCGNGSGSSGDGLTRNPKSKDGNGLKCFKCGFSGDVIDLYQQHTGADYNTALTLLAQEIGVTIDPYRPTAADESRQERKPAAAVFSDDIKNNQQQERAEAPQSDSKAAGDNLTAETDKTPQNGPQTQQVPLEPQVTADYTEYYRECRARINDPAAVSYLTGRGISVATAAAYWIGYDPQADPAGNPGGTGETKHPCPRIIIPTTPAHYVARSIDPNTAGSYKKMNNKGGKPGLFNQQALYAPDVQEVFITEGAFDALSIIEAGSAAVALNSTSNADELIHLLEKKPTKAVLILCLDNDDSGKRATDVLRQGLQRLNARYITGNVCGGYKDPNEYLQTDRNGFINAIQAAQRKAADKPDNVSDYIESCMGSDIENFKSDVKTGFSNLDGKTGGLYSGLYVVAAISSLGKTTFCAQIADNMAAAGHDVIFFSLEQSRLEIVTKSIARFIAQTSPEKAVTSLQIRQGHGGQIAQQAARAYMEKVGTRLSVVEGNFNCDIAFIGDYVRQYIRRNNTRPIVFIDYLQILRPAVDEKHQSTKETIDESIVELKRLSRELGLTIIAISSVNRANYLTPISFEALKESGCIEFSADVVWGLQLQCLNEPLFEEANKITQKRKRADEAKEEDPRKIELRCLKNRYGVTHFRCSFSYYPKVDLFNDADIAARVPFMGEDRSTRVRI